MKVSFVATVYNEEKTIVKFIDSIFFQEKKPDEIIIVDGGSSDKTLKILNSYIQKNNTTVKVIVKKGNRSIGRNEGIRHSAGDVIAISDAGCILDKKWLKNIVEPFKDKKVDVVAGYYKGEGENVFQKSLIPYVLVMPDRVREKDFLPASRSMAFRKSVWKNLGGFPEKLSHNEDYFFAKKIEEKKIKIIFVKNAIVKWIPRNNLKESFIMFFRFAYGDAQAGLFRPKVLFIVYRYFVFSYLFILSFLIKSSLLNMFLTVFVFFYILWSIYKNYKYVNKIGAFIFLPLLQFISDAAVISGTILGSFSHLGFNFIRKAVIGNYGLFTVIAFYILAILLMLSWGIPNNNHPFTYFMDEWHQSQSVRNLFQFGTPNIPGSANGSIFHFFLVGIYLIPFQLFGVIDVTAIRSSVSELSLQNTLFHVLRFNTLIFGVMAIASFAFISKKYFKFNSFVAALIFTFNPLWIIMSSNFKYDVALMFWILISFLFLLKYVKNSSFTSFLLASFFSSLALSVKFSAIPLLPILFVAFFLFDNRKNLKTLLSGMFMFIVTFLLIGIPDVLFGRGNVNEYVTSVIFQTPNATSYNYYLGMNFWKYLLIKIFPITFGTPLYYSFLLSLVVGIIIFFKHLLNDVKNLFNRNNMFHFFNKELLLAIVYFVFFAISLYPLKIESRGNRAMVLLPFMIIIAFWGLNKVYKNINIRFKKLFFVCAICFLLLVQFFQTFAWMSIKLSNDIRSESSEWILQNIKHGTKIGIENIPIYQLLPDIVVKEFYAALHNGNLLGYYKYSIINNTSSTFPEVIILSNDELENKYFIKSDKKLIVGRLQKERYVLIKRFKPDFTYFKHVGSDLDFYIGGLVFSPNTISIYERVE